MTQDPVALSFFQVFTIGHLIAVDIALLAMFLFRTGHSTGERRGAWDAALKAISERVDAAGHRMSDRAKKLQDAVGRAEFLQRDLAVLQKDYTTLQHDHDKTDTLVIELLQRLARVEGRRNEDPH